jgi:zinc transport system permease protein
LVVLAIFGRALVAISFDEEAARVTGLPVDLCNLVLSGLTAVTIVAAMRVLGILLVAAMMVLPVASSRLVARSLRSTMLLASGIGIASAVGGLGAAGAWDLEPGGSIVLCAAFLFAAIAVFGRSFAQQTART